MLKIMSQNKYRNLFKDSVIVCHGSDRLFLLIIYEKVVIQALYEVKRT